MARLKCRLSSRGDPYFALQPVKVEEMHHDPDVVLFHEVISEKEMKIVKEIAGPLVRLYSP